VLQPDDWYTVTMTDLKEVGFPYYLGKLKLAQLLSQKYPEHKWERVLLLKGRFAPQRRLERTVASLFPVSFHYPPPPPTPQKSFTSSLLMYCDSHTLRIPKSCLTHARRETSSTPRQTNISSWMCISLLYSWPSNTRCQLFDDPLYITKCSLNRTNITTLGHSTVTLPWIKSVRGMPRNENWRKTVAYPL